MSKTIGVVLSGCGVFDGTEIYEAAYAVLCIDRAGAKAVFMAPNVEQMHVINHLKGEPAAGETRNVLVESARIARGNIRDIATVKAAELDALMFPGGFGAAKNLSNFATDGASCAVNPEVERLIREMHDARKPLGFVCIAPAVAARVLGKAGVSLTIGNDSGTADALAKMGARHVDCGVTQECVDELNKVITAPAYMYHDARPSEVFEGIRKTVEKLVTMA